MSCVIPKPVFVYKLSIYKMGTNRPYDTIYCLPENILYWVGMDYAQDGEELLIEKVMISPIRSMHLFPDLA